ncbi:hypothetical protein E2320_007713 [Naja naja]|nr:hypothetical protein E2320_007713 [Naja naja]
MARSSWHPALQRSCNMGSLTSCFPCCHFALAGTERAMFPVPLLPPPLVGHPSSPMAPLPPPPPPPPPPPLPSNAPAREADLDGCSKQELVHCLCQEEAEKLAALVQHGRMIQGMNQQLQEHLREICKLKAVNIWLQAEKYE